MADCYYKWFEHYRSHCDSREQLLTHFEQNASTLNLDKAKTLLSIGAGKGCLDSPLVTKCMPQLKQYIGIDPDKDSITELASRMEKFTGVQVSLVNSTYEAWSGPVIPIDVTLIVNCIHFIPDRITAIKQMYGRLNPGGTLIIVIGCKNNLFTQIVCENLEVETHYSNSCLKKDLMEADLDFQESEIVGHISTASMDDAMLRRYFKYIGSRAISDPDMDLMTKLFRERHVGENVEFTQSCLYLTK